MGLGQGSGPVLAPCIAYPVVNKRHNQQGKGNSFTMNDAFSYAAITECCGRLFELSTALLRADYPPRTIGVERDRLHSLRAVHCIANGVHRYWCVVSD